jgi:flagellin-like protein
MNSFLRSKKALSAVLATLLLIVVAIAAIVDRSIEPRTSEMSPDNGHPTSDFSLSPRITWSNWLKKSDRE